MVKSIVFHLGGPKTGSTSIQETLAAGNWDCKDVSLLYPANVHHIALAKTLRPNAPNEVRDKQFKKIAARIETSNKDIAVISAEYFERADPVALKAAVEKYMPQYAKTARYISYVRPHADRLVSAFAERVKAGTHHGTLEELHKKQK